MAFGWQPALGFMICLSATASVAAQDAHPLTILTIDQPLHFLKEDGGDVLLPPGLYRLEAAQERNLRLLPEVTADPMMGPPQDEPTRISRRLTKQEHLNRQGNTSD